ASYTRTKTTWLADADRTDDRRARDRSVNDRRVADAEKWMPTVYGAARQAWAPDGRSYAVQAGNFVVQRAVNDGDKEIRRFGPVRETVRSLAFSAKGKLACLMRGEVILFDVASGKEASRIRVPMHYPLA